MSESKKESRIGETNFNNQGLLMKIVEYKNNQDIVVEFEDGVRVSTQYDSFKTRRVKHRKYPDSRTINRIGEQAYNNQGLLMTIIDYKNAMDVDIKFEDGYIIKRTYQNFQTKKIENPNYPYSKIINRLGEVNTNNQGIKMKIVRYNTTKDIDIEFDDGYTAVNQKYYSFKNGEIKNPNYPSVFNVGYMGKGNYSLKNHHRIYNIWSGMLERCYSPRFHIKSPTYKDCTVDPYFHCFQNFAKWYEENLWCDDCTVLDKDILIKGNKVYSPDSCSLVDSRLNSLFVKCDKVRGKFPIGVRYVEHLKQYVARCSKNGKMVYIGSYTTVNEAFQAYKQFKENHIKEIADEYKKKYHNFPQKLYEAMYNYEVEIDD